MYMLCGHYNTMAARCTGKVLEKGRRICYDIRKEKEVRALEEDQKRQKGRIRLMEVADLDAVAKIWLDVNRQAHDFIPAAYWEENFAAVKEMLPSAEVYVWEEKSGAGNPGSQIEDSKICGHAPSIAGKDLRFWRRE